ncbi:glycosyltransferase family 2 protein [Paracoccus sp. MC1862]|nr:glycosyltransferase family 2 protein [Paracoccus sp. MC1862]MBB1498917.1 glycosyltransferase [Paracoccus sp. MC1862]
MAVYNGSELVSRAIESVLSQDCESWELICVDDGSSDGTLDILRQYADKDRRINVISQNNSGAPLARLRAMQNGTGKYIFAGLDHDDYISPDFVSSMKHEAECTGADTILCDMHREIGPNQFYSHFSRNGFAVGQSLSGMGAFVETFPWRLHALGMWKRELVLAGAEESLSFFNSYDSDEYFSRLMMVKSKVVLTGSAKYYYCMNYNSVTTRPSLKVIESLDTIDRLMHLAESYKLTDAAIWRVLLSKRNALARVLEVLPELQMVVSGSDFYRAQEKFNTHFKRFRIDLRSSAKKIGAQRSAETIIAKLRVRQIKMFRLLILGRIRSVFREHGRYTA